MRWLGLPGCGKCSGNGHNAAFRALHTEYELKAETLNYRISVRRSGGTRTHGLLVPNRPPAFLLKLKKGIIHLLLQPLQLLLEKSLHYMHLGVYCNT